MKKAGYKSNRLLFLHFGVVGAFQQIIHRHMEIICDFNQLVDARLALAGLIAADGVLICIQLHSEPELGYALGFPYFLQTQENHSLTLLSHIGIIKISQYGI